MKLGKNTKKDTTSPQLKYVDTDMHFNLFANPDKMIDLKNPIQVHKSKEEDTAQKNNDENNVIHIDEDNDKKDVQEDNNDNEEENIRSNKIELEEHKSETRINLSEKHKSVQSDKRKTPRVSLQHEKPNNDHKNETSEDKKKRGVVLYRKLMDLQDNHGIKLSKKFYPDSDPDEMEDEYNERYSEKEKRNSVKAYKKFLVGGVSIIEWANKKYDPFSLDLNGWSESMHCSMDEYTEVFQEIHEKYKNSATGKMMEPEVKLMLMIAWSAGTFHMSQEAKKEKFYPPPLNINQTPQPTPNNVNPPRSSMPFPSAYFNKPSEPVINTGIKAPQISEKEQLELIKKFSGEKKTQFISPPQKKNDEETPISSKKTIDLDDIDIDNIDKTASHKGKENKAQSSLSRKTKKNFSFTVDTTKK